MILPASQNLDPIIIGTTYDPGTLQIYIDDTVKDLTSAAVTLQIMDGPTVIDTLTASAGLTIDALNGLVAIELTNTETAALTAGSYQWYLQIVEATGEVYRYIEGYVEVRA